METFIDTKHIRVGCLTWNCAGNAPPTHLEREIHGLVLPEAHELKSGSQGKLQDELSLFGSAQRAPVNATDILPHFYVVGLQEMVNLEVVGSLLCSKDVERMSLWESLIGGALNAKARPVGLGFACVAKKVMFGCFIMLFARMDSFKESSFAHIKTVKVKTGTKGMTANKGAVALRFTFEDTSFMFMNCHLTSGQKKVRERFADVRQAYAGVTSHFD